MFETIVAVVLFVCLVGASLGTAYLHPRLPKRHLSEETHHVLRACTSIFAVMTSLVLGLLVNSAKNTFDSVDKNLHAYATEIILLDRTLRQYGPETAAARAPLRAYVEQAAARMAQSDPVLSSRRAENFLREVADALRALKPQDAEQTVLKTRAEARFEKIYEMRWTLVEQSRGTLPMPLIVLLGAWLTVIFVSLGFRAPRNAVVITCFLVGAALMASAVYLILDMDSPFDGNVQVSPAPLYRALAEMR